MGDFGGLVGKRVKIITLRGDGKGVSCCHKTEVLGDGETIPHLGRGTYGGGHRCPQHIFSGVKDRVVGDDTVFTVIGAVFYRVSDFGSFVPKGSSGVYIMP